MARSEDKKEPTVGTTLRLDISFATADAILRSIRAVDDMAADAIASDDDYPLQAIKDYATKPAYKTVNGRRVKARDPLADSLEDYLKGFLRVGKVRWKTVLDENTAEMDRSLNGTVWNADDPAAPLPPLHPNSLISGQLVCGCDVIAAYCADYSGPIVDVLLANGARLSGTINHMLLTPDGFARLQSIAEGDEVFYSSSLDRHTVHNPDDHRDESLIENVVESLAKAPGARSVTVPVSTEHLHNDGAFIQKEVRIVYSDGLLADESKPVSFEHFGKSFLKRAHADTECLFSGNRQAASFFYGTLPASARSIGGEREALKFLWRPKCHAGIAGVTTLTGQSEFSQPVLNDFALESEFLGNSSGSVACMEQTENGIHVNRFALLKDRHTCQLEGSGKCAPVGPDEIRRLSQRTGISVELVRVVDVRVRHYSGSVYDLMTRSTLYATNGIVNSNCRCARIPEPGPIYK